jgi:hypothetical protein
MLEPLIVTTIKGQVGYIPGSLRGRESTRLTARVAKLIKAMSVVRVHLTRLSLRMRRMTELKVVFINSAQMTLTIWESVLNFSSRSRASRSPFSKSL